ncbi:MAG: hypothetical protein JU82_09980 [Sulfuricurvum sp. MLSB]|jgi:hypothetical protein|uniref:HK97 gp10 family phage protein n=1 Tax=Sulfuricurvum sp. MLSB TaxID=1537917 RepID=UPI0004FFC786|nr:HK97 gp10 family phage protein [Sulfuricurvum sp. MLSB]KFN38802.1 MAG: hypothetical protein JU82_09980 [Sulfuricurvum sp. MLSB]
MIRITHKGQFQPTFKFFNDTKIKLPSRIRAIFEKYGQIGVMALQQATPIRTGETASQWGYEIDGTKLIFTNDHIVGNGIPLAILIQYGHGTGTGGYVQGIDYINPALRPIFDKIADDCLREVANL